MIRNTLALLLLLSFGCQPAGSEVSKQDARAQKADGIADKLCELAGEEEGCDICQVEDWYGDGICDDFCGLFDVGDCVVSSCADLSHVYQDCRNLGGTLVDCEPGVEHEDLTADCCGGDDDPAFCVDPSVRPDHDACDIVNEDILDCEVVEGTIAGCLPADGTEEGAVATMCCEDFDFAFCEM